MLNATQTAIGFPKALITAAGPPLRQLCSSCCISGNLMSVNSAIVGMEIGLDGPFALATP